MKIGFDKDKNFILDMTADETAGLIFVSFVIGSFILGFIAILKGA